MSNKVQSMIDLGTAGLVVDIECNLTNNLPAIVIVGHVSRAVDEARERVRGAFASCNLPLPRRRITINLAPADIPKVSSSFDLAIAAAILQAGAPADGPKPHRWGPTFGPHEAIMGELGLDGTVRPVRGIIGKILAGRDLGLTTFYIPAANLSQARMVPGVHLVPLTSLKELASYLEHGEYPDLIDTRAGTAPPAPQTANTPVTLSDVIGQVQAKRALEIAAAGGHNVLLSGPPGTGKSMLARAFPSILPPLTPEEMLEVTHLHSLASQDYDRIVTERPFRAPHHSASHIGIVGGGSVLRPGEISLAHRGVLFFDEFPEFSRPAIESLRQPLEDRRISVSRMGGRLDYPADFLLIATANPCPCGYYGGADSSPARAMSPHNTGRTCECPQSAIQRYRAKLSGPIMDRIDLYSEVHEVEHQNLLSSPGKAAQNGLQEVIDRIQRARSRQHKRFSNTSATNATMSNRDIVRHARLTPHAKSLLDMAGRQLGLSARGYMRTVRVARTIADLDGSQKTDLPHVTEALQFRRRN